MMETTQVAAFGFGAVCFLILLVVVLRYPNPTEFQYTFLRIMLAVVCACVAVVLTGFLTLEIKGFIQAGGALAVFVIVFFYKPAALRGSSEWQHLRQLWRGIHDIHDAPTAVNPEDVVSALNALNETGRAIEDNHSLLGPFRTDYAADFCRLYGKLARNKYPVTHLGSTSDLLLSSAAHKLAREMPCSG